MPIKSSAKKALRQSLRKKDQNNIVKRVMKESIKEFKSLVSSDIDKAKELLPKVYKSVDKAVKSGILKKNTAARKKSQAMKSINTTSSK